MNANDLITVQPKEPSRTYKVPECILAWLTYLCAYLFCCAFPVGNRSLGGFLLIVLLYTGTAVLFAIMGTKLRPYPVAVGISAVLLAAVPVISANPFLNFFAYGYAVFTYLYFVYVLSGKKRFSDMLLLDYARALFILPFRSLGAIFRALFMGRGRGGAKVIGRVLAGFALTLIPTLIVAMLLSYDSSFSNILAGIFRVEPGNLFRFVFATPLGMAAFSVYASATDGVGENSITEERLHATQNRIRVLSPVTALAAVLPLSFLYVVLFISQWKYYISGFTGVLPENFSYAEYAREGFFQLCTVSVINFLLILTITLLLKRKDERPPLILKLITVVFSVFTLILISTAISKMVLYINRFGLTQMRVYATWFMLLLAVLFILMAISMFTKRLKVVLVSVLVCLAFFSVLALSSPDSLIAEYNVERYLDGTLAEVDVTAMYGLGDSAVPAMVRLYEEAHHTMDQETLAQVTDYLEKKCWNWSEERPLFAFNLPAHRAKKALSRILNLPTFKGD
ncbi:MAG: DUF4173 domain-containing protein [Clostridia bacterium]|nr:DUF4173 domain-containing protein [Clostridia bacterium]